MYIQITIQYYKRKIDTFEKYYYETAPMCLHRFTFFKVSKLSLSPTEPIKKIQTQHDAQNCTS